LKHWKSFISKEEPGVRWKKAGMIKPVSGFSLLLGFGVTLGLGWAITQAGPRHAERIFSLGVLVLFCALLSSRTFYVLINWGYYRGHLLDILWIWQGGFSGVGALLGGIMGLLLVAWYAHLSPAWLADQYLPLLASLVVSGWLACWLAGCAYGAVSRAWWALPARDEWGVSDWRVPVQLLGALLAAGSLFCLERWRKTSRTPGLTASLFLFITAVTLLALSFLRADPMPLWWELRADAWGALLMIAISIFFGLYCVISSRLEYV
jgi:phosphatidylglycerol:prolipoprotein diacylglycerol transferase